MAHSFRKTPVFSRTGVASDKSNKRAANRVLRAHFRTGILTACTRAHGLEGFNFDQRSFAHSNADAFDKEDRAYQPQFRAVRAGNKLTVLNVPHWVRTVRRAHQELGK